MGFGTEIIRWIKFFNCNVQASMIQCGILSSFFAIKRGCRQGDPSSPYLFILSGQILSILAQNEKNKGNKMRKY